MTLTLYQIQELVKEQHERLYTTVNLELGMHRVANHGQQKDIKSFLSNLRPREDNQRQGRSSPSLGTPDGFVHVEKPK